VKYVVSFWGVKQAAGFPPPLLPVRGAAISLFSPPSPLRRTCRELNFNRCSASVTPVITFLTSPSGSKRSLFPFLVSDCQDLRFSLFFTTGGTQGRSAMTPLRPSPPPFGLALIDKHPPGLFFDRRLPNSSYRPAFLLSLPRRGPEGLIWRSQCPWSFVWRGKNKDRVPFFFFLAFSARSSAPPDLPPLSSCSGSGGRISPVCWRSPPPLPHRWRAHSLPPGRRHGVSPLFFSSLKAQLPWR